MKFKRFFIFLLLLIPIISAADSYDPQNIVELRAQYNLLIDLRNSKEISEAIYNEKIAHLEHLATEKFNVNIDNLDLLKIVPTQKIDWIGSTFYLISALLVFLLISPLFFKLKGPFFKLFKTITYFFSDNRLFKFLLKCTLKFIHYTWEIIAYLMLAFALYYFNNEYIILLTSFLSGSLISYSIWSRKGDRKREAHSNIISWSLTFLWAAIALWGDNSFVGFMSVAAFISSIGFSMFMFSGMIEIGFKKDNSVFVLRLTGIAFFLSLFSWLFFYTTYLPILAPLEEGMRVFETGMVSLIPLVYFLGLGYMTFFLFQNRKGLKIICELTAFFSGVFVLLIALMYGIGSMFWIGLLFMTWFAIDKYYELVYKRMDFVWAGLILAGILGGTGYLIKSNITTVMEHLVFLNL